MCLCTVVVLIIMNTLCKLLFVSLQSLLREVHQEGMQVLSLSELPCDMGGEGAETAPHLPLQGWTKEREALLATVESLKTLIAKLQMHKGTQVSGRPPLAPWKHCLLFETATR